MSAYWKDLLERVVWTFIQAALAGLTTSAITDISAWQAALIAGVAAVFSLLKSVAAHRLEELGTAQLIPGGGTYSYADSEAGHL